MTERYPPVLPAELAESFRVAGAGGTGIAVYAWREAPADAPALLFGHANGFNAGCYAPFLARLARHFRVFAFDARGHGASDKPAGEPVEVYAMDLTAQDLAAVASAVKDRLGPGAPLHYASHSLGGIAAVLLEGRFGEAPFASLTLFEPPIYPSETSPHYETALASSPLFTRWSAKRREHFPDRDALRREAMAISTFASFAPEMMDAYVAAAAYETAEGDLALYCPGAVESAFYANCPAARVYEACAGMRTPAVVFSSDPAVVDAGHVWTPASMREVAAAMADGRYAVMPGCRHLMVQEQPAACAERVVAHVAECVTA